MPVEVRSTTDSAPGDSVAATPQKSPGAGSTFRELDPHYVVRGPKGFMSTREGRAWTPDARSARWFDSAAVAEDEVRESGEYVVPVFGGRIEECAIR